MLSSDEVLGEIGDGAGEYPVSENVVVDELLFHPKKDVSLDPPGDLGFVEFDSYDSSDCFE